MQPRNLYRNPTAISTICLLYSAVRPIHAQSEADFAARADRASRDSSGGLGCVVKGGASGALFGAVVGGADPAARIADYSLRTARGSAGTLR